MISGLQDKFPRLYAVFTRVFSWENALALIIALVLIAIYILTATDAPIWLYQGF